MATDIPLLYSFRRCPYAMRARMALATGNQNVELREIILRDKPEHMVEISPKATVPVLLLRDGTVIEESLDVMLWSLERHDPNDWLVPDQGAKNEMLALIEEMDGPFKTHLDRYKYASRHEDAGDNPDDFASDNRDAAMEILQGLDERLSTQSYLFGERISLADIAIAPFIRQFANTDRDWFDLQSIKHLQSWLNDFLTSDTFTSIMTKYPKWCEGDEPTYFPNKMAP